MNLTLSTAWAALLALLTATASAPAADHPSRDHGGADLVLEDGDRIWGVHENVGRFVIPEEVQVDVHRYYPDIPGSGRLDVHAREIVIEGLLNADGAGYTGGAGRGGRELVGQREPTHGERGANGKPRYEGYDNHRYFLYSGGDGPAAGVFQLSVEDQSLKNGGYNVVNGNTDMTRDITVLMGSGGSAGSSQGPIVPWFRCSPAPRAGRGGSGGHPGGGAVRLFAEESLVIEGAVHTGGARGSGGVAGEFAGVFGLPGQECEWTGANGGKGGDGDVHPGGVGRA